MEKKVFRSRISVFLCVFILLAILPGIIIPIIHSGTVFNPAFYGGAGIGIGLMIFVIFIFSGIRYEITDDKLLIKACGIPDGSYSISQITSIKRSYNILSSPAASLKRLRVNVKKGSAKWSYCLISPVLEQEFLETLKRINPDIEVCVNDKKGWWRFWDWDFK